jgi:hypothetical protein
MSRPLRDYAYNPVGFIDAFIQRNEKGQRWSLSGHQRRVLDLVVRLYVVLAWVLRLLLWGEMKKSGKTLLAAALGLWWGFTRANTDDVDLPRYNDDERPGERDREPRAHMGGFITPYGVQAFHGGGEVMARLLPGEFVMRREAVRRIGVGQMAAMNRGAAPAGLTVNVTFAQPVMASDYTSLNAFADYVARAIEHRFTSLGYQMPT